MTNSSKSQPLLRVENLVVSYRLSGGLFGSGAKMFNAVDSVSFEVGRGEIAGLVGESGSGKTTIGRAIVRLAPISGGKIFYDGVEISALGNAQFLPYRKKIQMIFQDPFNSLNPRMRILDIISEPMDIHFKQMNAEQKREKTAYLLERVGLKPDFMNRYPHEFSGGQRQRIAIARSLVLEPKLLILDEPTSALDVTIQAQIIKLLQEIQTNRGLSYIFISHDMNAVRAMSDNIMVMKDGKAVEFGTVDEIFNHPQNPYTQKLIHAAG